MVQGFFRDYYYTRGSAFSFLAEEKPEYARYFTPWAQVMPTAILNPTENQIVENYCSGASTAESTWSGWILIEKEAILWDLTSTPEH